MFRSGILQPEAVGGGEHRGYVEPWESPFNLFFQWTVPLIFRSGILQPEAVGGGEHRGDVEPWDSPFNPQVRDSSAWNSWRRRTLWVRGCPSMTGSGPNSPAPSSSGTSSSLIVFIH
jgi:hypothetical protein